MYANRSWYGMLLLVPLALAAACGTPEQEDAMDATEETGAETATEEPIGEIPTEPVQGFSIALEAVNESGVTGTATATPEGESVVVDVQVTGASADEELPAHVHQGTCATGGSVLVPLTSVQITDGSGNSSTTLTAAQLPKGQAAFVQVHSPDGQPVACADLPGDDGM